MDNVITLTRLDTGESIVLPSDLIWSDEFTWVPVVQSAERTITGARVVDTALLIGGRPITLEGEGITAYITRGDFRVLHAWVSVPNLSLALLLHGEVRNVRFVRGGEGDAKGLSAEPVINYSDKVDGDYYSSLVLRFTEE